MNAATLALNPGLGLPETPSSPARTNAKNTGKAFEKELERTADAYEALGIATLKKVDPPVRVMWIPDKARPGQKRQHVIFVASPWLDMAGCWTARHARALFIEAKSTSNHRLAFNGDSGFKAKQWEAMKAWRRSGAACALLWQFNGAVMLFTPEMLRGAENVSAKSLRFADGLTVGRGAENVVWDFLPVLERANWPTQ